MSINFTKKKTKDGIHGSVWSEKTHRSLSFTVYADEQNPEPAFEKVINKFKEEDEKLLEIYNVSVKKLALSADDVLHLSEAEIETLDEKIDFDQLRDFARAYGIENSKDKNLSKEEKNKALILALLQKEPGLDLGLFLYKKDPKTRDKDIKAQSFRIKDQLQDNVLAIENKNPTNVIFKDGTHLGEGFYSKKVINYLEALREELKSASIERILEVKVIVDKMSKIWYEYSSWESFISSVYNNENIDESDFKNKAVMAFILSKDVKQQEDDFTSFIVQLMPETDDWRQMWFLENIDYKAIAQKARGLFDQYLEGVKIYQNENYQFLKEAADQTIKEFLAAEELYKNIKPWVIKKLQEEKKPITERRVQNKIEEFININGKNKFFNIGRYDVKAIFKKELEETQNLSEESKKEKTTSPKRVRKPENAADLLLKEEGLSEEDKNHLIDVIFTSYNNNQGGVLFFEKGLAKRLDILTIALKRHGKILTSMKSIQHHRLRGEEVSSYLLRGLIELGAKDLVDWNEMSHHNVEDLIEFVPAKFLPKAIALLCKKMRSNEMAKLMGKTLERVDLSKLPSSTLDALYESCQFLIAEGRGQTMLSKYLPLLNKVEARFYPLMISHEVRSGADVNHEVILSRDIPELSFLIFQLEHKKGNYQIAKRYLKSAIQSGKWEERHPDYLSTSWSTLKIADLFRKEDIVRNEVYADIILLAAKEHRLPLSYAYSMPENLKNLLKILKNSSFSESEKEAYIVDVYGIDSEIYVAFKKEKNEYKADDVIESLQKQKDEVFKSYRQYRPHDYEYRLEVYKLKEILTLKPRHLEVFDQISAKDQDFVIIENILSCSDSVLKKLSPKAKYRAAQLARGLFEKEFHHHSKHHLLEKYLSVFGDDENLSAMIILGVSMTPKQAVLAAKTLEKGAVSSAKDRLQSIAEKSEEALFQLSKIVNLELSDKQKNIINGRAETISGKIKAGDFKLSEKEWEKFFKDYVNVKDTLEEIFDEETKVYKVLSLGETFDLDLKKIFGDLFDIMISENRLIKHEKTIVFLVEKFKAEEILLETIHNYLDYSYRISDKVLKDLFSFVKKYNYQINESILINCAKKLFSYGGVDEDEKKILVDILGYVKEKDAITNIIVEADQLDNNEKIELLSFLGLLTSQIKTLIEKSKEAKDE